MEASMKSAEFLKQRREIIGGSDVAAIVGESEYDDSPINVWRQKVEGYEIPTNDYMTYGSHNEPLLAHYFEVETRRRLSEGEVFLQHPEYPWAAGHIDRLILDKDGKPEAILEIKTAGPQQEWKWGDPGTDVIPQNYLIQVQWYLGIANAVHGITEAVVYVQFRGDLTRHQYNIVYDPELFDYLRRATEEFREKFILKEVPPPVDASEEYRRYLSEQYPTAVIDDEPIQADAHQAEEMRQLFEVDGEIKSLEAKKAALKNSLMKQMGEHPKMVSPLGSISWTNQKGKLNPWSLVKELNPPQELIDKHTGEPTRSFRLYPKKEKK